MKIIIARHAEPDYIHDTITEKGKKEAALLAKRLSQIKIDEIYVSPLGRAKDTAAYTLQACRRRNWTGCMSLKERS